jgi:hypothetical protein
MVSFKVRLHGIASAVQDAQQWESGLFSQKMSQFMRLCDGSKSYWNEMVLFTT